MKPNELWDKHYKKMTGSKFDEDIKQLLLEGKLLGTVIYNEIEESHVLRMGVLDIGLYPLWEQFEGKKIRIKIEILNDGC